MKLDRYDTGIPRFRVFRHLGEPLDGAPPPDGNAFETEQGDAYLEVDPWECFVLKRRDRFTKYALVGYAIGAMLHKAVETAEQIVRLRLDWKAVTDERGDEKTPD